MGEKRDDSLQETDGISAPHDHEMQATYSHDPKDHVQKGEAKNATDREHQLTIGDALKLYPKGVLFSLIFSTAIIMEGYDLALIGSLYGYTA